MQTDNGDQITGSDGKPRLHRGFLFFSASARFEGSGLLLTAIRSLFFDSPQISAGQADCCAPAWHV